MIVAIILVIIIFSLLVFVHELGHFVAARRGGIQVDEFGFGFPPRAIGKKVGDTIYSINWLPLGGFVRMKGEDSADRRPRSFGAAPFKTKVKVMLAGVGMNALVAYVILLILCIVGIPASVGASLTSYKPSVEQAPRVLAIEVTKGSPAAQAGIVSGDQIVSISGQPVLNEDGLVKLTKQLAGSKAVVTIEHNGTTRLVDVQLRDAEAGKSKGYLGVAPFETHTATYGKRAPIVAAQMTLNLFVSTVKGFIGGLAAIAGVLLSPFSHHKASGADVNISGPVGIVALLANISKLGFGFLLFFVANISASLAVINILPIPPFDGSKLFLIVVQRITGKQMSARAEERIAGIGFVFVIALLVVLTIFDVQRVIGH